jgi:nucleotide-binding universal stress UspA family protein
MMSKIVVGYDGSAASRHALERAAELAQGDPVIVVSAVHRLVSRSGGYDRVEADEHRRHLDEAETRLAELGVGDVRTTEDVGDPATVIANEAEANEADLIIVGSEEKNLIERLFGGSVSAGVIRKAKTEVLVVH